MKSKLFSVLSVVAIAIMAGINVFKVQNQVRLSDVGIENVEALANNEINPLCPNGCLDNGCGCYCYNWYPTYREAGEEW